MRRGLTGAAAAALTVVGALAGPLSASASAPAPQVLGNDVSFPQCGTPLPGTVAVAVVGVNDGLATGTNPCLAEQLEWAALATAGTGGAVELYANTANPGHAASWWPTSDTTRTGTAVDDPAGTCTGGEGSACAYVYGYSLAVDDLQRVPAPGSYRWWLDVETINSWSADLDANRASVAGMADALRDAGADVGLYSTRKQWTQIVGNAPAGSSLAGLDSWMAGAVSRGGADAHCDQAGLTGGAVRLAQYVSGGLDYDVLCRSLTTGRPTISGTVSAGTVLTAHTGAWAPSGLHVAYQWRRNGRAIDGATSSRYVVTTADVRAAVTVTVSGGAAGYTPASRTSAAVTAPAPVATTPAPSAAPVLPEAPIALRPASGRVLLR